MGYELRRELREVLGPEITGLQRAVALEITDDANDGTRKSFASLEDLVRWTGAKDTDVVRNALKRLARAGWEFRVPVGTGKDGRLLYAVPGKKLTFRVPPFQRPAVAVLRSVEGGAPATPSTTEGVAVAPSQGAVAPSQGAVAPSQGAVATPIPSIPSIPSAPQTDTREPGGTRQPKSKPTPSGPIPGDSPYLDDVEAVCEHLADVLEKTGSKRPAITKQWRDATRRLIDADRVTPERAIAAIDWAHASPFWQAHILTPMKLREKYDTLRRQALAEQQKTVPLPAASGAEVLPFRDRQQQASDDMFDRAMARALDKMRQEETS